MGAKPSDNDVTWLEAGPLHAALEGGRLHSVRWHGVQILRGISAPVRDSDWGTLPEVETGREIQRDADGCRVLRRYRFEGGTGQLIASLDAGGVLSVDWHLTASADLTVNRAGLCVLHPLVGTEGARLDVTHPDGRNETASFPQTVSPVQPVRNIAGLRHDLQGVSVSISFEGEVFEMEDQRNWSDASYKTYCRPLSLPFPFTVGAGEELHQRVVVTLTGTPRAPGGAEAVPANVVMPEILLAVEPGWQGPVPPGCGRLARFGAADWDQAELAQLADAPFDAEFVVPRGEDPAEHLGGWARRLAALRLAPRHVVALPEPYLKSHQPDGPWPDGPRPSECVAAARAAFPGARIGAGMLTHFAELNRCPPADGEGDYITHGNSAIVHAADDLSVLQTLEALPSIFGSARVLGCGRGYRLGLVSIALRSNPYGSGLQPNPDRRKRTMTDTDPRQGSDFAAAYALAATALAAQSGAEAICLAAPAGPFALAGPLEAAISALASLTGREATVGVDRGRFRIESECVRLLANATLADWPDGPGGALTPTSWRLSTGKPT